MVKGTGQRLGRMQGDSKESERGPCRARRRGGESWSNRRATPALSSAEAEYFAIVKAAAETLGIEALAKDLGWEVRIHAMVDSTAAKAIASRNGLGKVRHLEVRYLFGTGCHFAKAICHQEGAWQAEPR